MSLYRSIIIYLCRLTLNSRVKSLEGSMNRLLEARQKQIETQDMQLKAIKDKNISLQQQLEVLKLKVSYYAS